MSDIVAIIPARSGSKSIIDKNIKLLSNHPLIAYSIAVAKLSKEIDRVIVSTNSVQYADIAIQYGAEVPFIRPDRYSTSTSTDRDFLIHTIEWLQSNKLDIPEYWVHLRPTTPLRIPSIIDEAIGIIKDDKKATSLRSGHKATESPLKWFVKNDKYFKGFLHNEDYNLPKEKFNQVYIPDGYVDILKSSFMLNNHTIHGDKMIGFESPVCTEIDSREEFDYIQYQINKSGSFLVNYLDQLKE